MSMGWNDGGSCFGTDEPDYTEWRDDDRDSAIPIQRPVIQICAWCPWARELTIALQRNKKLVSHGICVRCMARNFPELPLNPRRRPTVAELMSQLRSAFGNYCAKCGINDGKLEFAHKHGYNKMNGRGRGGKERYRDISNNMDKYILVCRPCHRKYDGPAWSNPHHKKSKKKSKDKNS